MMFNTSKWRSRNASVDAETDHQPRFLFFFSIIIREFRTCECAIYTSLKCLKFKFYVCIALKEF